MDFTMILLFILVFMVFTIGFGIGYLVGRNDGIEEYQQYIKEISKTAL